MFFHLNYQRWCGLCDQESCADARLHLARPTLMRKKVSSGLETVFHRNENSQWRNEKLILEASGASMSPRRSTYLSVTGIVEVLCWQKKSSESRTCKLGLACVRPKWGRKVWGCRIIFKGEIESTPKALALVLETFLNRGVSIWLMQKNKITLY